MAHPKVDFHQHDELIAGKKFDLEQTVVMFTICEATQLDRKALAKAVISWRNLKIKKNTSILMMVDGYGNDPRELWEIPKVREFIQKFCAKTKAHEHPAVEAMSRNMLLLCGADPTRVVTRNLISNEEHLKKTMESIAERLKQ